MIGHEADTTLPRHRGYPGVQYRFARGVLVWLAIPLSQCTQIRPTGDKGFNMRVNLWTHNVVGGLKRSQVALQPRRPLSHGAIESDGVY